MNAQELQLDYFIIYKAVPQPAPISVTLFGQFDRSPRRLDLDQLVYFACPASNSGEPLFDVNAHLIGYRPNVQHTRPTREVDIENQLGKATVSLADAIGLLTPAMKRERRLSFPQKLDHYKLYDASSATLANKIYNLKDQFGSVEVMVFQVEALGVPVAEVHGQDVSPIHNERAHLTLYSVHKGQSFTTKHYFEDQFGWHQPYRLERVMVAIPSIKRAWREK